MSPETIPHHDVRPLIVHDGRSFQPLVCKVNVREILFRHRATGEDIPVPWRAFVEAAAGSDEADQVAFLHSLLDEYHLPERPLSPDLTETAHADRSSERLPVA